MRRRKRRRLPSKPDDGMVLVHKDLPPMPPEWVSSQCAAWLRQFDAGRRGGAFLHWRDDPTYDLKRKKCPPGSR